MEQMTRSGLGGASRVAGHALAACLVLFLMASTTSCTRGCVRDVSLVAKKAAERYLAPARLRMAQQESVQQAPYQAALAKLRGLLHAGNRVDWRLMSMSERQQALVGLVGADRGEEEERMLDALLTQAGIDPFLPDPSGVAPLAAAMLADPRIARRLTERLAAHPLTRPSDLVLCGLRSRSAYGSLATLRPYCACVPDD